MSVYCRGPPCTRSDPVLKPGQRAKRFRGGGRRRWGINATEDRLRHRLLLDAHIGLLFLLFLFVSQRNLIRVHRRRRRQDRGRCLFSLHFERLHFVLGDRGFATRGRGQRVRLRQGRRHEVRLGHVGGDRAPDPEHLPERVLVAMLHLEVVERLPEHSVRVRVAELATVRVQRADAINLAQARLQLGVLQADVPDQRPRQRRDRLLVDLPGPRHAKELAGLVHVDLEQLQLIIVLDALYGTIVDLEGVPCQTVILLELGVHQVQDLGAVGGRAFHRLFEQFAGALQLLAAITLHEFGQVRLPDRHGVRELEPRKALLVRSEGVLEEPVRFEQRSKVQDRLRRRDLQLDHAVVGGARRLQRTDAFLQVDPQAPQLGRPPNAFLHGPVRVRLGTIPLLGHRCRCTANNIQGRLEVLQTQLHLDPGAPHVSELFDSSVLDRHSALEDDPGAVDVPAPFVEAGEPDPDLGQLAVRFGGADRVDRVNVRPQGGLVVVLADDPDAFQPLADAVRVLPQQDRVHEQRATVHQVLEPHQTQVDIVAVNVEIVIIVNRIVVRLHLGGQHALFVAGVRVEHDREVADRHQRVHGLLEDVARLLELPEADVVMGQRHPQGARFRRIALHARAQDRVGRHCRRDGVGVLDQQAAQFVPQVQARLAVLGHVVVVVDQVGQELHQVGVPVQASQNVGELRTPRRFEVDVPPEDADGGLVRDSGVDLGSESGMVGGERRVITPHVMVLRDGQRLQGAIERQARLGDLPERPEEFRVQHPEDRAVRQDGDGAFECDNGVGGVVCAGGQVAGARRRHQVTQVPHPDLVRQRQGVQRALVQRAARIERVLVARLQVPDPGVDRGGRVLHLDLEDGPVRHRLPALPSGALRGRAAAALLTTDDGSTPPRPSRRTQMNNVPGCRPRLFDLTSAPGVAGPAPHLS